MLDFTGIIPLRQPITLRERYKLSKFSKVSRKNEQRFLCFTKKKKGNASVLCGVSAPSRFFPDGSTLGSSLGAALRPYRYLVSKSAKAVPNTHEGPVKAKYLNLDLNALLTPFWWKLLFFAPVRFFYTV